MTREFGHYRLEELLGQGGMGQVWRAFDTATKRHVALKLLPEHLARSADFRARFEREAHTAATLQHPHIVPIHTYGEIEGQLYIDMALLTGTDLGSQLREQGALEPARAVEIIAQTASALDAAHAAGLIHRDIKPSNIFLHSSGFAYLIDFGIARRADQQTALTNVGDTVGTVAYMAPERFNGIVAPSADIYALACVLYEALTGQRPYGDATTEQQIAGHLLGAPPRPTMRNPRVPPGLDAVIATGMAKDPQRRYPTAMALGRAAQQALVAPPPPRPAMPPQQPSRSGFTGPPPQAPTPQTPPPGAFTPQPLLPQTPHPPPPRRPAKAAPQPRRKTGLLVGLVLALVLLVVGAVVFWPDNDAPPPPEEGPVTYRVAKVLDLGGVPESIAVNPTTHDVYVSNYARGTIAVVDGTSFEVDSTIRYVPNATQVAVDPQRNTVYVTDLGAEGRLHVVDGATGAITTTVPVGVNPVGVTVDPPSGQVFVANWTTTAQGESFIFDKPGTVTVVDAATNTASGTITVGKGPFDVAVDGARGRLYVSNEGENSVSVVDLGTKAVTATIAVGEGPKGMVYDQRLGRLYVANNYNSTVSVIDTGTDTVTTTIPVPTNPFTLAVDRGAVYVGHYPAATDESGNGSLVSVIDTGTLEVTSITEVGASPGAVAVDPQTRTLFVADAKEGKLYVLTPS